MEEDKIKILKRPPKGFCACGRRLHYSDPLNKQRVEELIRKNGEFTEITYLGNGKTYIVQRHYIALHGIKAVDLPSLGFEEKQ